MSETRCPSNAGVVKCECQCFTLAKSKPRFESHWEYVALSENFSQQTTSNQPKEPGINPSGRIHDS